jgi:hypothetical protein
MACGVTLSARAYGCMTASVRLNAVWYVADSQSVDVWYQS